MAWKKQYTPEERAAYQEQKRAEIEAMFKRIDEGVQQVFTSEKYRDYLKFMSQFTDYSARNTMLIAMQRPDATLVAAFNKWKQMGRQVNKGESGIEILAPVTYKTNQVMEYERQVVDEWGNPQYNDDGTEKKEILADPVMGLAFKKVYVFDVSQTSGKEIPSPVQELHGDLDADRMRAILKGIERATGISIKFEDFPGGAKGYYSPASQQIVIRPGMSDVQTLKTAFHEAAHSILHNPDQKMDTLKSAQGAKEVQAESTAFILAERYGVDTSDYSFPYIASWSDGKQLDQLTKVLDEIQQAAKMLTHSIDSELLKMQKKGLTQEEMLADSDLTNKQKAEILIDHYAQQGVEFTKPEQKILIEFAASHENISDTVQKMADMAMIERQAGTPETPPPDVSPEEYLASMDFDAVNRRPEVKQTVQKSDTNPNIMGNISYKELCKSEVQYFPHLKPRHAENIAKALTTEGIPFSGVKKGYSVTLTVRKADVPQYEAVVAKVKASYSKTSTAPAQPVHFEQPQTNLPKNIPERKLPECLKDVPIITISPLEAKQNGMVDALKDSIAVSRACRDFIDSNLHDAYENRDLKGFVQQLEDKFGLERAMYTIAATIQLKKLDGRFYPDVKKQAAQFVFDSDKSRLRFLTEQHPVMLNHLFEVLMERAKELQQTAPVLEKPKLPDHLADKYLLSTERVSIQDDYRGIPETKYYKSSVNEYFVENIGWLDNDAYDREQKLSGERDVDFYKNVTKINAACVDAGGIVSNIDMTKQEYDLLTEKTYSPENKQALELAKAQLSARMERAGIKEKPTEQYAVRQTSSNRYAVCTISADGLVTAVKPGIATIAEAKKAMLELFEQRKQIARCELVHPQVLDEKSAELYQEQKQLPDVVYRIQVNEKHDTPETHFVQQYIRQPDDTYKVGEVTARGDYFACNAALAKALTAVPEVTENKAQDMPKEYDLQIYQVKNGEALRELRFQSAQQLAEMGLKPDIANYDLVYEGNIADFTKASDLRMQLETVFYKFNMEHPADYKGRSVSVSDVVAVAGKAFYVDSFGFKPLNDFPTQRQAHDKTAAQPEVHDKQEHNKAGRSKL